jgi:hypothetical protein
MREISGSGWKRRGSSIVFDREELGPLIAGGCMISLREALSWMKKWPSDTPGSKKTVLVSGLEAALEIVSKKDAEDFLGLRIRPFIQEFQACWDQIGLIFGFSTPVHAFRETSSDEDVVWTRRDRKKIELSRCMWNGSSTLNLARIVRQDAQKNNVTAGYHVPRIS